MSTIRTASIRGLGGSTPKRRGWLAALDATPELPLGRDDEVLVERIGMGRDLECAASFRDCFRQLAQHALCCIKLNCSAGKRC